MSTGGAGVMHLDRVLGRAGHTMSWQQGTGSALYIGTCLRCRGKVTIKRRRGDVRYKWHSPRRLDMRFSCSTRRCRPRR
jgi:hypothetical protein